MGKTRKNSENGNCTKTTVFLRFKIACFIGAQKTNEGKKKNYEFAPLNTIGDPSLVHCAAFHPRPLNHRALDSLPVSPALIPAGEASQLPH